MNNSNEEFIGKSFCEHCKGKGKILVETLELIEECDKCGGKGTITWLEGVFGRADSRYHKGMIENLYHLQRFMINYGIRCGVRVDVRFEKMEDSFLNLPYLYGGK